MNLEDAIQQLSTEEQLAVKSVFQKLSEEEISGLLKAISILEKPKFLMKPKELQNRIREYAQWAKNNKFILKCNEQQEYYDEIYTKNRKENKDKIAHGKAIRATIKHFKKSPRTINRNIVPFE
jgi:hypothetical protein